MKHDYYRVHILTTTLIDRSLWREALHQIGQWCLATRGECRVGHSVGHRSRYGQGSHPPRYPSTPCLQRFLYQTALPTPGFCFAGPCDHAPSPSHGRPDTIAHKSEGDTPLGESTNRDMHVRVDLVHQVWNAVPRNPDSFIWPEPENLFSPFLSRYLPGKGYQFAFRLQKQLTPILKYSLGSNSADLRQLFLHRPAEDPCIQSAYERAVGEEDCPFRTLSAPLEHPQALSIHLRPWPTAKASKRYPKALCKSILLHESYPATTAILHCGVLCIYSG